MNVRAILITVVVFSAASANASAQSIRVGDATREVAVAAAGPQIVPIAQAELKSQGIPLKKPMIRSPYHFVQSEPFDPIALWSPEKTYDRAECLRDGEEIALNGGVLNDVLVSIKRVEQIQSEPNAPIKASSSISVTARRQDGTGTPTNICRFKDPYRLTLLRSIAEQFPLLNGSERE